VDAVVAAGFCRAVGCRRVSLDGFGSFACSTFSIAAKQKIILTFLRMLGSRLENLAFSHLVLMAVHSDNEDEVGAPTKKTNGMKRHNQKHPTMIQAT
jgi:hypothetical protein